MIMKMIIYKYFTKKNYRETRQLKKTTLLNENQIQLIKHNVK